VKGFITACAVSDTSGVSVTCEGIHHGMYSVKYKCLIGFFTACAVSDTSGVSVTLKELITAHVRYEWCECYV
jgi:hypothetical protein